MPDPISPRLFRFKETQCLFRVEGCLTVHRLGRLWEAATVRMCLVPFTVDTLTRVHLVQAHSCTSTNRKDIEILFLP